MAGGGSIVRICRWDSCWPGISYTSRRFFVGCVMVTAIAGVHWPNGLFSANRGYEYPMTLLGIVLALLISGGGQLSVDKALSAGRASGRGRR